jgi:tetratricopeptide (TPR) repeat protein
MRFALVFSIVLFVARAASAQEAPAELGIKPAAKQHLEAGLRAYSVQEYAKAIEEFRLGYQLDNRPEFLYAMAQAERLSGDCERAIRSYEAFLRASPPERQVESARQNIGRCREELNSQKPPLAPTLKPHKSSPAPAPKSQKAPQETAQQPPPAPPALAETAAPPLERPVRAPAPRTDAAETPPWYTDATGDLLVGSGLLAVVVGGVVWKSGRDDIAAANAAMTYDLFASHADGAQTRQTVGAVTMVVGGGLMAFGLVRYLMRPGREHTSVTTVFAPGAAMLQFSGRFR